jgi:hypothetical protein
MEIDVMEQSDSNSFAERAERHPVSMRGFAMSPTRDLDVRIRNLSYTGCQLACGEELAAGELVQLRIIRHGAIEAEIRWSADGRAGARFIEG